MRVVIDTNVFVSSFFGGNPRKVVDLWKTGAIALCLSKDILEEYMEVLGRLGLIDEPEMRELFDLFTHGPNIIFTSKTPDVHAIPADPDDDKFIACALALQAEVVVTGDKAFAEVGSFGEIRITNPSRFLADFGPKNPV